MLSEDRFILANAIGRSHKNIEELTQSLFHEVSAYDPSCFLKEVQWLKLSLCISFLVNPIDLLLLVRFTWFVGVGLFIESWLLRSFLVDHWEPQAVFKARLENCFNWLRLLYTSWRSIRRAFSSGLFWNLTLYLHFCELETELRAK